MNQDYVSAEHDRMLAALIMPCEVVAVDLPAARVRVRSGDWTSGWVRWHSQAAGAARHWRVPSLGKQGVLLSPSGSAALGTFVPGLFGASAAAPNNRGEVESWHFPDGAMLSYDWQAHRYDLQLPSGNAPLKVGGTQVQIVDAAVTVKSASITLQGRVTIEGALAVKGNVTSTGSIMDTAGNSNHHTH